MSRSQGGACATSGRSACANNGGGDEGWRGRGRAADLQAREFCAFRRARSCSAVSTGGRARRARSSSITRAVPAWAILCAISSAVCPSGVLRALLRQATAGKISEVRQHKLKRSSLNRGGSGEGARGTEYQGLRPLRAAFAQPPLARTMRPDAALCKQASQKLQCAARMAGSSSNVW